jgi:predicted signal transduction protein with EAL and GGDEF domain
VNDTLGHQGGDELLRQVARRLRDASRASDFPGRLGGDEFALLQVGQADPSSGGALAAHIVRCLAQPFEIGGVEVEISASIGIATSPVDSDEPGGLFKKKGGPGAVQGQGGRPQPLPALHRRARSRSFLQGVPVEPDANAVARAVIALANDLHLHVIAEGVEEQAQAVFLQGIDCAAFQGFLFSRAMPAPLATAWLLDDRRPAAAVPAMPLH